MEHFMDNMLSGGVIKPKFLHEISIRRREHWKREIRMKTWLKITVAFLAATVVVLGSIASFLLIPRKSSGYADDIWYGEESFDMSKITVMEKAADRDFKILAITDVQFDNPFKSKKQIKSDLAKMVEKERPDMIVTVGDNFAGIFNHFHVKAFVDMMDSFGLPWAPIYGNHERDFKADLVYLGQQMQQSDLCLFKIGPTNIDGVGNYFINIHQNGAPIASLIMMDCNEEIFLKDEEGNKAGAYYESPRHSQVEWYRDNVNGITAATGKVVPSVLFTHTPLPQFKTAYDLYNHNSSEVQYMYGEGEVGGGAIDYGLFDAVLELGSTRYMFFGHEHENTLGLEYKGIHMCFVVKTGNFSSYREGKTGGTIITISDNGKISSRQLYASEL